MKNWIQAYLKKHPIEGLMQIVTAILFALNLWLSARLLPIVTDIIQIKLQVAEVEAQVDKHNELMEKNSANTIEIREIKEDIREIKAAATRLEGKVDRIVEQLIP